MRSVDNRFPHILLSVNDIFTPYQRQSVGNYKSAVFPHLHWYSFGLAGEDVELYDVWKPLQLPVAPVR